MSVAREVVALERGTLVVDLSPLASPLRIRPWGDGLDLARWEGGEWRTLECTADVQIALDQEDPGESPLARFVWTIPAYARLQARRCGEHHLAALRLLRHHPRARVLARTPNFLWLLARLADARGLGTALAALAGTTAETLAACIGGPVASGAVGLLARVLPEDRARAGEALFAALRSPRVVRALCHKPVVTAEFLLATSAHEEHCSERFFLRFLRYRWHACEADRMIDAYQRAVALGRRLGIANPEKQINRGCERVPLDRWKLRALRLHGATEPESQRYPPPAIAGTARVVPLTNSAELLREGDAMANCLFTYDEACRDGEFSAYRVLAPERATLLVRRDSLEIEALRAWGNGEPSEATYLAVAEWLAAAQPAAVSADDPESS